MRAGLPTDRSVGASGQRRKGITVMRWFNDRSVAAKVFTAVAVVAVAALVSGWMAVSSLAAVYRHGQAIEQDSLRPSLEVAEIKAAVLTARVAVRDVALAPDKDAAVAKLRAADDLVTGKTDAYLPHAADPGAVHQFQARWQEYSHVRDTLQLPAARAGDLRTFEAVATEQANPIVTKAMAALDAATQAQTAAGATLLRAAGRDYRSARMSLIALLAGGIIVGLVVAVSTVRKIVVPLRRVCDVLERVSDGDLTTTVTVASRDEVGVMAGALNRAT